MTLKNLVVEEILIFKDLGDCMFEIIELKKLLKESIEEFYKKDYNLLKKNVHEQAITHRIAFYFENKLPKIYKYSVDVEYNRKEEYNKQLYQECRKCCHSECVCNPQNPSFSTNQNTGRPDIIFHFRGNDKNNLLVIEAKKIGNENVNNDNKKLTYLTCMEGKYKYQLGGLVVLGKKQATIIYYQKGKEYQKEVGAIKQKLIHEVEKWD